MDEGEEKVQDCRTCRGTGELETSLKKFNGWIFFGRQSCMFYWERLKHGVTGQKCFLMLKETSHQKIRFEKKSVLRSNSPL